tara:strand:+ start:596 stop:1255 length:660 start_codon:yes stop_codon:yes gene_type:complete
MSNYDYELNEVVHATLLNPYLSKENFQNNCDLITKYNIKNISTSLNFLKHLKDSIIYKNCKINALISYPLADVPSKLLSELINYAKEFGANKIEFLPRFFYLSDSKEDDFAREIEILIQSGLPITVIFNYHKLEKDVLIKAINICLEMGILNFQFGDGFGPYINKNDIDQIINLIGYKSKLKITGGIKYLDQVIEILNHGASSIGTSDFHNIFKDLKSL